MVRGDSVWCMSICTHPHLSCCENLCVYAARTHMTCVLPASFQCFREVALACGWPASNTARAGAHGRGEAKGGALNVLGSP